MFWTTTLRYRIHVLLAAFCNVYANNDDFLNGVAVLIYLIWTDEQISHKMNCIFDANGFI